MKRMLLLVGVGTAALSAVAGKVLSFSGSEGGAAVAGVNYANLKTFSACAWVRNPRAGSSGYGVIFSQGSLGDGSGFGLYLTAGGSLDFQTRTGSSAACIVSASLPTLLADDNWHLVGVTHDFDNKVKRIWLDGDVVAEETAAVNIPDPSGNFKFVVGSRHAVNGQGQNAYDFPLKGQIADVSLWSRVLTADDFARMRLRPLVLSDAGLLGAWSMGEGSGKVVRDQTSAGNNLSIIATSGISWTDDETFDRPLQNHPTLTATYGSAAVTTDFNFSNLKTFSTGLWVRNPNNKTAAYAALVSQGSLDGANSGFSVYMTSKGVLSFQTRNGSDARELEANLSGMMTDDRWHFIVVTHDWENKSKCLYVDGELKAEAMGAENLVDPSSIRNFTIASRQGANGTFAFPYQGSLARVSLWQTALSAEDVKRILSNGLVGDETGLLGYWPMDEGQGSVLTDKVSNGSAAHPASFNAFSVYSWTTSPLPVPESPVVLRVADAGVTAFSAEVGAFCLQPGETAEVKVVWGQNPNRLVFTNTLGSVTATADCRSGDVIQTLLPGATYHAKALVVSACAVRESPVVSFTADTCPPVDYQVVDYIESTGAQLIDTGYKATAETRVELSLRLSPIMDYSVSSPATAFFGATEKNVAAFSLNFGGGVAETNKVYCWLGKPYGSGSTKTCSMDITTETRSERNMLLANRKTGAVGWASRLTVAETGQSAFGTQTLALFGNNDAGTRKAFNVANMRLYACRLWEGHHLVRDYVPCYEKSGSGRVGLYDLVGGVFYPNSLSAVSFVKGNDAYVTWPLSVVKTGEDCGEVVPTSGDYVVPAGCWIDSSALSPVSSVNPHVKCFGWELFAKDGAGVWQPQDHGDGTSCLFAQPAKASQLVWKWGRKGLSLILR